MEKDKGNGYLRKSNRVRKGKELFGRERKKEGGGENLQIKRLDN